MPAGFYRAQVTIPMDSGIPADSAVNVWSFANRETEADEETDAALLSTRLRSFYAAIVSHLSSRCNVTQVGFKLFNLVHPAPRIPVLETTWADLSGVATNADLPPEVAVVLSFRAQQISGTNARRRRGRIYLGPLQVTAGDAPFNPSAMRTAIMDAAGTHIATGLADPLHWSVYSPYTHRAVPVGTKLDPEVHLEDPDLLDQAFSTVRTYWVDDAWDTQRRRGTAATVRLTDTND